MKKTLFWLIVSGGAYLLSGCTAAQTQNPMPVFQRPLDYEKIEVIDKNVSLSSGQQVSVSTFGYNPRKWEPAALEVFNFPINWIKNPRLLNDQIFIVKQVGNSSLFCFIEADENSSRKERLNKAMYSLFIINFEQVDGSVDWSDYLRKKFGVDYFNHRAVEISGHSAIQMNWNVDLYWSAPMVFVQNGDDLAQLVLIYSGPSRTYINQIMNKFPWRTFSYK